MTTVDPYISGWNKASDWRACRAKLVPATGNTDWEQAFEDFFSVRLRLRYLDPIKVLQDNGSFQGEGFSIVAIQCTLVEFLESTVQGINYQYANPGPFEYSGSRRLFVQFLTERPPFRNEFSEALAKDFYEGVRCGLLHEARTKNGWTIWGETPGATVIDAQRKIVYRNNFQTALLDFVARYKKDLLSEVRLQEAFIRKFDAICA